MMIEASQSDDPLDAAVVGVAGPIGSGKSSLARDIASSGRGQVIMASNVIRRHARELGMDVSRRQLQDLGWHLVSTNPTEFAKELLNGSESGLVVVDGVRQWTVWRALIQLAAPVPACLVFVDISRAEQLRRVLSRDGVSEDQLQEIEMHPVEKDLTSLHNSADLVVDGGANFAEVARDVLAKVRRIQECAE
jgi:dephospho-CoA kinase